MFEFDKIAKEITDKHAIFFGKYGHQIPSSILSFSSNEYLKVIGKVRSSGDTHEDFKRIPTIDILYRDFVDSNGIGEMKKPLDAA